MTDREVDALFGEPLRVFTTRAGRVARLYGSHHYSAHVNHFFMFSNVAVLFGPDGRAANVYSEPFFYSGWDPDTPPGRRD